MNHEKIIVSHDTCHKVLGQWYFQLDENHIQKVDEPDKLANGEMLILAPVPSSWPPDRVDRGALGSPYYVYKRYRGEITPHDVKTNIAKLDLTCTMAFVALAQSWPLWFALKRSRYLIRKGLAPGSHTPQDSR